MPTFRLFTIAASCVVSLMLFLMSGDRLLTFLNVDLISTVLRVSPLGRTLETNEAVVMTQARQLAMGGALALGVAIVLGFVHAVRRPKRLVEAEEGMVRSLFEREAALVQQYRELGDQLQRSRAMLADDVGETQDAIRKSREAFEARLGSIEASVERLEDTLKARLEGLVSQVSQMNQVDQVDPVDPVDPVREAGQADDPLPPSAADASAAQPLPEEAMAVIAGTQAALEQLTRRVEGLESLLRANGDSVGSQLTDLSQRMAQVQSVNNSRFDDFNSRPAPLGSLSDELQSVILNLTHLQIDLRAERSALRKRLRELPAARQA